MRFVIHGIAAALQDPYDPFYEFADAAKDEKDKTSWQVINQDIKTDR